MQLGTKLNSFYQKKGKILNSIKQKGIDQKKKQKGSKVDVGITFYPKDICSLDYIEVSALWKI